MNRIPPIVTALSLLAIILATAGVADDGSGESPAAAPDVLLSDLMIEPAEAYDDSYSCSLTLVDASTGETLARPEMLIPSGEDARLRTVITLNGELAELGVVVNADAVKRTAIVRVELTRAGDREAIAVQQLQVRL